MPESERKTCTVHFEPSGLKTEVTQGANLLDTARKVGVYLSSICGGDGCCGERKVTIDSGQYECKPTTLLTPQEQRENIVLACQTRVLSDLTVTIGKSHVLETDQILTDSEAYRFSVMAGQAESDFVLDPLVRKVCLEMSPPTVQDHTADHERMMVAIRDQVHAPVIQMGYRILQELPHLLQKNDYKVTATVGFRGGATEIVQIEPQDRCDTNYAVAVDLGTTTVVAHLLDLTNGETIDTEATYNSQINFGEDYIRRIIYAEQNDAFDELQDRIVHDVNNLIVILAERRNISLQEITAVICAGNTAMTHFLLNLDPTRIRREPYIASASVIPPLRAAEVGIHINKRGLIYFLPSVAAYVGGDIVAGVLATRLHAQDKRCLLVDIGTNGEVVLGNAEWIVCASSSAGPAFEGSGVKHGMRAATGAIEKLQIRPNGDIETQIIGDAEPIGLCGSGLLDTISELFLHGIIDRTGRFRDQEDSRLTEGDDGSQFTLIPAHNGRHEIVITQADIHNLIRSKAGVFASIKVLMETTQTQPDDLDAIYLAGGFGNYLNVERAITVGLLPDISPEKIHFVGNTSIAGAKMALLSRQAQAQAEQIATAMTYTDLMSHPGYMEEFVQANFLPHTDLALFPSAKIADSV